MFFIVLWEGKKITYYSVSHTVEHECTRIQFYVHLAFRPFFLMVHLAAKNGIVNAPNMKLQKWEGKKKTTSLVIRLPSNHATVSVCISGEGLVGATYPQMEAATNGLCCGPVANGMLCRRESVKKGKKTIIQLRAQWKMWMAHQCRARWLKRLARCAVYACIIM